LTEEREKPGRPSGADQEQGSTESEDGTLRCRLVVECSLGLHARSAAKIVALTQGFDCEIVFSKDGHQADGDSILALLTLNCPHGAAVEVEAWGPEAPACLEALSGLFARCFDEE